MYEIIYDYDETERNLREKFEGTWQEVADYVADLRALGYYNIAVNSLENF